MSGAMFHVTNGLEQNIRWLIVAVVMTLCFPFNVLAQEPESTEVDAAPAFTIALTGKYPPFSFYSGEGELVGFDVDVSGEVAARLGRPLEIVTTEWDGILAGLLSGRYDAIIGSMAITPERAEQVNFSTPYYISGAQLFIHRDDQDAVAGLDDLDGRRVGAVLGTTFEHYLTQNYPGIQAVTYKSETDIYQDMMNRRLAGFITDRLVGSYQIRQAGMPFVAAGPLLYEEQMGIPVNKSDMALLQDINAAIQSMQSDGTFERLHEKWFSLKGQSGDNGAAPTPSLSTGAIARKLGRGFAITIWVAFASLLAGFLIAVPVGIVLHRGVGVLGFVLRSIVDFIRGTPVLIQLFFVYFSAPQIGIALTPIQSAILTLSLNAAAYMAEVIRSGLMAVPPGQRLAARALGLTGFQTFRHVVWPQAFRIAIPPLMNSAVALMKDTALVSVISVAEVIREAQSIISVTYDPMRYYFIVAIMFFVFTFPLMKLASRLEQRLKSKGFRSA